MGASHSSRIAVLLAFAGMHVLSGAAAGDRQAPPSELLLRHELLAVEDARAPRDAGLARLVGALREPSPVVERQALRALGRLERPALIDMIAPMLQATDAGVRSEAAAALAQSLLTLTAPGSSGARASAVSALLLARVDVERDPDVLASILTALGRLPFEAPPDIETVERRLTMALSGGSSSGGAVARLGAARGLEWLSRLRRRTVPMSERTAAVLSEAVTGQPRATDDVGAQTRRFAISALTNAKQIDRATLEVALDDPDDQVRRLAAVAAGAAESLDGRAELLRRALKDASFMVRYDAVRAWGRRLQASDCGPIREAAADGNAHVALAALDLLADACPDPAASIQLLTGSADSQDWRRAAHALVSLARLSKDEAVQRLERFATHRVWQARMYAARAAGEIAAVPTLQRLSTDDTDNVREAAITALRKVAAHDADATYIAALGRGDYQLIQTAADALEGSTKRKDASVALLASFGRLTAQRRDTSRDPRMAIVKRLRELGSAEDAPAMRPCLRDFDPAIAAECATVLTAWTGQAQTANPQPPNAVVVPEMSEIAAMDASVARIAMRGAGTLELRLFADEAPVTVARFVRLARAGYYNGLTFHRVVPNFVIQGGSPGANEYMGDADFLRDEVGDRTHARGTLGISTRGRDTGDAQIFVNLADNPRLDHVFTVFAEVSRGMDVIDGIGEGDVIDTIQIVRGDTATVR